MDGYSQVQEAVAKIRTVSSMKPTIGIICGSGLGGIGDLVKDAAVIKYGDIPGFHKSSVVGHKGQLLLGQLNGINVVCMQGRVHGYEGIPFTKCAFPVRVFKLLGVKTMIVTNAAGGLNSTFKLGDFMILQDHLPLAMWGGNNPLVGANEDKFGPRFPAMSDAYDRSLMKVAKNVAADLGQADTTRQGTYAMMFGPTYETIAELRMLRQWGADAVGMSTAPEVVAARHCGITCLGISMITNICVMDYESTERANHAEVIEIANKRARDMEEYVSALVVELHGLVGETA